MHWIRIMDASSLTVLSLLFHLPKWKWDWASFKLWGEGYSGQSIPNPHQRLFLLGIRREAEERVMLRVQLQWCSAGPSSICTLGRLVRDSEGCGLKRGLPWTHLDTICCTITCPHSVIKGTLKPQVNLLSNKVIPQKWYIEHQSNESGGDEVWWTLFAKGKNWFFHTE